MRLTAMVQTNYVFKASVVLCLFVAAIVALSMLQDLGSGRAQARQLVADNIEEAAGGPYKTTSPVLAVVLRERWQDETARAEVYVDREYLVLPSRADIAVQSAVETRQRGIFPGRIATTKQVATTVFGADEAWMQAWHADGQVSVVAAYVVIGMESSRGVASAVGKVAANDLLFVDRGAAIGIASSMLSRQLIAPLPAGELQNVGKQAISILVELEASGGDSIAMVPLAQTNSLALQANWQHLKYSQRLPTKRALTKHGATATWHLDGAALARQPYYGSNDVTQLADSFAAASITATFVEPVDIYSSLERSVKYGWLIVLVTLGLVLLFDHTRGSRLHPAQYGMVAVGLVLFFLLLLSLGEHIGFALAYAAAAVATCALCAGYLFLLFRKATLGASFACYFAGVYVSLYVILRSEDYALLLGSFLLLIGLAIAMWLTRGLHHAPAAGPSAAPPAAANALATRPQ